MCFARHHVYRVYALHICSGHVERPANFKTHIAFWNGCRIASKSFRLIRSHSLVVSIVWPPLPLPYHGVLWHTKIQRMNENKKNHTHIEIGIYARMQNK